VNLTYANPVSVGDDGARQVSFCKEQPALNGQTVELSQEPFRELHIGGRRTGITIQRDAVHRGMWRVRQGDELSDITNISRAKEAAITWARPRGLGGDEVAHWHHRQSRVGASPVRQTGRRRP